MNFFDLANLLDNDGNMQNEMMLMSFAATMLATIPVSHGCARFKTGICVSSGGGRVDSVHISNIIFTKPLDTHVTEI